MEIIVWLDICGHVLENIEMWKSRFNMFCDALGIKLKF
jgi:hypothetical protein